MQGKVWAAIIVNIMLLLHTATTATVTTTTITTTTNLYTCNDAYFEEMNMMI